jgi:hypothetical protein
VAVRSTVSVRPRLQPRGAAAPLRQGNPDQRRYSTTGSNVLNEQAGEKRGLRISHLFGGLAILGMFVTIYGL